LNAAASDIRTTRMPPTTLPWLSAKDTPEFGDSVLHRETACTPRELFCKLFLDLEDHPHFLEPAFIFAAAALERAEAPAITDEAPRPFMDGLVAWADARPSVYIPAEHGSSWPARVAREFAPMGLADGAWLRGSVQANTIETEVGMRLLRQFMLRFGDPGSREAYSQRYVALLRSLGTPPDSITRWDWDDSPACTPLSYEHGLLGLSLGLFPASFHLETLGFNLWMACVGPCPLLVRLEPELRLRDACLRYLDLQDRDALTSLARDAVVHALLDPAPGARERISRGFAAAERSYQRWQDAMCGRNVPVTARQFVLETIARKARFSAEHHGQVRLGPHDLQQLMQAGPEGHEQLLDALALSPLIRPGQPDKSPLLSHSLSIDGPMFDAFTAAEVQDLREWVASLPEPAERLPRPEAVPLAGQYAPPQDPASFEEFAFARYGELSNTERYCCVANSDLHPGMYVFGRFFVEEVLDKIRLAFESDPRLNSMVPPPYSERALAEMVAAQHDANVRSRSEKPENSDTPDGADNDLTHYIGAIFDGCWLQGFADVQRAGLEEYGWLFRIYASEQGDGRMVWNHCRIFRHCFAALGPNIFLPKTEPELYSLFDVSAGSLAKFAVALNTRRFLPEILGTNLGIEASGVGGWHFESWKVAEGEGKTWKALAHRLHNSIDNYADGHTKWSLAAVQAFMRRVRDTSSTDLEAQWQRVWRLWRLQEILEQGSDAEQAALAEHIDVTSLAPA
jgi:hypothetical protein